MNFNTIEALGGQRFVLFPADDYARIEKDVQALLRKHVAVSRAKKADYEPFVLTDYVRNPVALARINAGMTQVELAKRLGVSQPYIAKLEAQGRVSKEKLDQVNAAL
jgi:ribosome-binding protein aMBF1 (putative translation factor)